MLLWCLLMSEHGGSRSGAGRKKSESSKVFKSVGLTAAQWEWLDLWLPGGSPSAQMAEVVERSQKFWSAGPGKFAKGVK